MKIDLRQINIYCDISKSTYLQRDIREELGNIIFQRGTGIKDLSLATRIYESDILEITDEELSYLKDTIIANFCNPMFIYSFNEHLEKNG